MNLNLLRIACPLGRSPLLSLKRWGGDFKVGERSFKQLEGGLNLWAWLPRRGGEGGQLRERFHRVRVAAIDSKLCAGKHRLWGEGSELR